jgi:hypothetical protein
MNAYLIMHLPATILLGTFILMPTTYLPLQPFRVDSERKCGAKIKPIFNFLSAKSDVRRKTTKIKIRLFEQMEENVMVK